MAFFNRGEFQLIYEGSDFCRSTVYTSLLWKTWTLMKRPIQYLRIWKHNSWYELQTRQLQFHQEKIQTALEGITNCLQIVCPPHCQYLLCSTIVFS